MSITLALSKMYQFRGLDMVKKDDFLADHSLQGDSPKITVFENHRKSLIQHYEQSELRLHFEWTKVD